MIKTRFGELTELLEGQCFDPLADGNSPIPEEQPQEPLNPLPPSRALGQGPLGPFSGHQRRNKEPPRVTMLPVSRVQSDPPQGQALASRSCEELFSSW